MLLEKIIFTKIFDRSLIIIPFFEDKSFLVYNGKSFIQIKVTQEMIGKKFGEFVFTKKKPVFKSKKLKKKK